MKVAMMTTKEEFLNPTAESSDIQSLSELAKHCFKTIAPSWPLKNLIAVNPLQGLEELPIEEALVLGSAYFQRTDIPKPIESINRESIKWLQAYFDDGQSTLYMPLRNLGFYKAWRQLAVYDARLHKNDKQEIEWLVKLPESPEQAIADCLLRLGITKEEREPFLTLLLTTLPGWAAFVKCRTEWAGLDAPHKHPVTQSDYLAVRLIITCMLWPTAKQLLLWHIQAIHEAEKRPTPLKAMEEVEKKYRLPLLEQLAQQPLSTPRVPQAQLVFCIDVRSEPFRRALEKTGDYETLGFAGFFGIPIKIVNATTGEFHASCPVLLSPKHEVVESPRCPDEEREKDDRSYQNLTQLKRLYQSVKYTFTTPFALVEALGVASGLWMGLRTLTPGIASKLKSESTHRIRKQIPITQSFESIALDDQCAYAEGALRTMGLTAHFAPLVVFCGHGSATQNNAYATALDCGACGGRHGGSNALLLATILNRTEVRQHLATQGINIPETTHFIAAEHNTTTDELTFYSDGTLRDKNHFPLLELKADAEEARTTNSLARLRRLDVSHDTSCAAKQTIRRSEDWAQVRPEWGLARNAAFIVAPRDLTKSLDLEGRTFLHSYDYTQDSNGAGLTVILTAPMVVAEWINTQYLFSTLDNVAYGGGSKITKNITGKIGIMQGNASDLMTGLPLQSVFSNDNTPYHEPQRLMTVVYAPRSMLDPIIKAQPVLQKLFGNGWVQLACVEPESRKTYFLNRDFTWEIIQ